MAFDTKPYNVADNPFSGAGKYGEGGVADALQRLQGLQGALQSGQIDYSTYQQLFSQFNPAAQKELQTVGGEGSNAANAGRSAGSDTYSNLAALGGTDLDTFANQFKNLTGAGPTAQDITNYFSNIGGIMQGNQGGAAGTNYADTNTIINQYLQNKYQPQIQQNQTQQQNTALNNAQQTSQNLINQQTQQTLQNLTSPSSIEQVKAAYNNNGLLNSGAFSEGLGQTLGNAASGNISSALGAVTLPGINNIMGTQNQPYQSFLGNMNSNLQGFGQQQNQFSDFNLQKQLAEQLGEQGQPSTLQQWAPLIQGLTQGGAQLGSAAIGAKSAICLELLKRKIATQEEVDALHWKIIGSMFTRCRALIFYSKNGDALVRAANATGFDWKKAKEWFIDEPLAEKSSIAAINIYSLSCKRLAMLVAPHLWDENVMRGSFFDFLRFVIPVMRVPGYHRCYKDLLSRFFLSKTPFFNLEEI